MNNKKSFFELFDAIEIASTTKVKEFLEVLEWDPVVISKALSDSDLNVDMIRTYTDGDVFEGVDFHCAVMFAPNEVPGIISPFFCHLFVSAYFNPKTGKHSLNFGLGLKGIASAVNRSKVYDVDYLYNEVCKKNPKLNVYEFISNDFDFGRICEICNVKKVVNENTGIAVFENKP